MKRLKHQLWTYINPKIEIVEAQRPPELKMSRVLGSLYGTDQVDESNVSIHSAFICLLHIANEKGLSLEADQETDLNIFKALK